MNKNISNLHLDILDRKRWQLLQKLLPFTKGFVMGGGTALALQLAHRLSFDFDFFTPTSIPKNLLEALSHPIKINNIVVDTPDELTFFSRGNVKVTFLSYPFKQLFKPLRLEDGLLLFPVQEIALQKAYVIGRRGEYRDYFDLYTILKNGHTDLRKLVIATKRVYGSSFDEKLLLQQLVYFGDLSSFAIAKLPGATLATPEAIKRYFGSLVKTYVGSIPAQASHLR